MRYYNFSLGTDREYILNYFLTHDVKLALSEKDIKSIEKMFKENKNKYDSFEELDKSTGIVSLSKKVPAVVEELKKQFSSKKALQPKVLYECVMVHTIAEALGLNKYIDVENTNIANNPKELNDIKYIESAQTSCAARYTYFEKNKNGVAKELFVVQYGNPECPDVEVQTKAGHLTCEIKSMPALLFEKECLYGEDGKLVPDDQLVNSSFYMESINAFNSKTNIFDEFGSNFPLFNGVFDSNTQNKLIKAVVSSCDTDLIFTSVNDSVICFSPENLLLQNNSNMFNFAGSEIRTVSKNHKYPFTPAYLNKVLIENDVFVNDNICTIFNNNEKVHGYVNGRGHTESTRYKISNAFFIPVKDIRIYPDRIEFDKSKIKQSKVSISLHINANFSNHDEYRSCLYSTQIPQAS